MILHQIRLHPFGGANDRPVPFVPGLNVVLGPNEAGKSTLVNALRSVLFCSTQMSAVKFRNEMQAYVPVTGGDTVRVTLLFAVHGQSYTLEKCWGASKASRLCLPGGGELTGPDTVETALKQLLQFGEGTYHYVLITYQSHLAGTVDELRKNPLESTEALTTLLQRSIFQSDGVSVERLRALAREREEGYFGRWDREKGGPEDGRDIDKPWVNGVGKILQSWYELRKTERARRAAAEYEQRIDAFAARTHVLQQDVDAAAAYVNTHAPFVADARKRSELAARLEKITGEIPKLREVQQQWPRNEEQRRRLHDEVVDLREQYKALQVEQRQTEEFLRQQAQRETYAKARIEHDRLTEEEGRLAMLREISDRDIRSLRDAEAVRKSLQIKVESQKLALRIEARTPFRARFRTTGGDREVHLEPGESIYETTRGALELSHAEWTLGVRSATDDAVALQQALDRQTSAHKELCARLEVTSADEGVALQRTYFDQKSRVEKARSALQALIGKESYDSVAQRMEGLSVAAPGRSVSVISDLMRQVIAQGENRSRDEKDLQTQSEEWTRLYTDQDHLLDLLFRCKQDAADLQRQVDALAPLPSGVIDAAAYVADFDRKKDELATKKEELAHLLLERAEFEKSQPDESLEDLEAKLRDRRMEYDSARTHGEAYAGIRRELEHLVGTLDAETYKPLQDRFEQLVDQLTLHRYKGLQMEGPLPVRIKATDRTFTLNMLSQGTLDVLALAVRLGMAEYYLDGSDGFVVMDDPLVNLDPDRQKAAVSVIGEFASRKQAIILTCHPSHAEMLGGNLITL